MPVATHGAVKTLTPGEVAATGTQIILSNTYHLYLSPGVELIKQLGGIHQLIGYNGPILTDSGGFQVFSLGLKRGGTLAKIDADGVTFKSHKDGSLHRFSPKKVIDIQRDLGVDIMMPLDVCPSGTAKTTAIRSAVDLTHRWLAEQVEYWQSLPDPKPALFGIAQGGVNKTLRRESIAFISKLPLSGCALGGLAVGESTTKLYQTVRWAAPLLPAAKPRYLMGVGNPQDILWAAKWGIDMFDCVLPTRLARHGSVWLIEGEQTAIDSFANNQTAALLAGTGINIKRYSFPKAMYRADSSVIQATTNSPLGELTWARANHLAHEREIGLYRQFSAQNLWVINTLLYHVREAIKLQQIESLEAHTNGYNRVQ